VSEDCLFDLLQGAKMNEDQFIEAVGELAMFK
jgi:hypothetical protein